MHPYKFKLVASQAKSIYTFKNLREKDPYERPDDDHLNGRNM